MEQKIVDFSVFPDIMDTAVKDISQRVAQLAVQNADKQDWKAENSFSVLATTQGDYDLTIVFCTKSEILRTITENMKHGREASEEDIPVYITEFFNILCGHIVSAMNSKCHCKARFGIPKLISGLYEPEYTQDTHSSHWKQEYFYHCNNGVIRVETLCKCS